jgi:adenosine/AMP kinase
MELNVVQISKPEDINFVLGQSHFIKTVEDIHEALVTAVPGIQFGLAFCEASGACLVRCTGTNDEMTALARDNALAIGAGHSFILFLGAGFFPVNVLNTLKHIPEVCEIYCATANPVDVVIADNGTSRAVLGVFDGEKPKGHETKDDVIWRKEFLRKIGYKA